MTDKNDINYEKSLEYWAEIPATIDGVLGGFGFISNVDINGSTEFLKQLYTSQNAPERNIALDCGAGIGRITKYLLIPHFKLVDIIEPDDKFINTIKNFVGEDGNKIGTLYKVSLQDFTPEKKYDVIWNQWVLGYLNDEDLVLYLIQCRNALTKNGFIVVKENVTSSGRDEMDETDSSVTRSLKHFLQIFKKAKLVRVKQCKHTDFPNGMYPVYMFALVSKCNNIDENIKSNRNSTNINENFKRLHLNT